MRSAEKKEMQKAMLEGVECWIYQVDRNQGQIAPLCCIIYADGLREALGEAIEVFGYKGSAEFFIPGAGFVRVEGSKDDFSFRYGVANDGDARLLSNFVQEIERQKQHTQTCNDCLQDLIVEMHEEIVKLTGRNTRPWLKPFLESMNGMK